MTSLPGFDDLKGAGKEQAAKRFLNSDEARAAFEVLSEIETTLLESVRDQHDAIGLETIDEDELPSKEDRVGQLQQAAEAKVGGRFPEFVVETFLDDRLENADEAAAYADLSEEEWESTKAKWADNYREQGVEGDDEELARAHVRTRYDVDLDEFYHLVVNWPEGREAAELQDLLASGVRMANQGINRTTAVLEAADVQVDVDEHQEDLEADDVEISTDP
jgi:hypothetical protein